MNGKSYPGIGKPRVNIPQPRRVSVTPAQVQTECYKVLTKKPTENNVLYGMNCLIEIEEFEIEEFETIKTGKKIPKPKFKSEFHYPVIKPMEFLMELSQS